MIVNEKILFNESLSKAEMLNIILDANPAHDDIHTWVRTESDIKTPEEVFSEDFFEQIYPDFTLKDATKALKTKNVVIYSSYPIKSGVFVSPSKLNAKDYAGSNKIYSKEVSIYSVAWIGEDEGIFVR